MIPTNMTPKTITALNVNTRFSMMRKFQLSLTSEKKRDHSSDRCDEDPHDVSFRDVGDALYGDSLRYSLGPDNENVAYYDVSRDNFKCPGEDVSTEYSLFRALRPASHRISHSTLEIPPDHSCGIMEVSTLPI